MEEKRIKVEMILSEGGYSVLAESKTDLSPLEVLGVGELLKVEFLSRIEINKDLELSEEVEEKFKPKPVKDHGKRSKKGDKGVDSLPKELQEQLKKIIPEGSDVQIIDMTGGNLRDLLQNGAKKDCNCLFCRVRTGQEVDFNNLSEEDKHTLKQGADYQRITEDQMKKNLTEVYLSVKMQEELGEGGMPNFHFGGQVGEA